MPTLTFPFAGSGSASRPPSRYDLVWLLALVSWCLAGATRVALAARALAAGQLAAAELPAVFGLGALHDLGAAFLVTAPLALYLLLAPERI